MPAATGSLLQAWLAVGAPSRGRDRRQRAFAAWAGAATPSWVVLSLVVACAFDLVSAYVGAAFGVQHDHLALHPPADEGLPNLALGPLYHVLAVVAVAAVVALATAVLQYGSLPARFRRLLRPWALAQVPIAIAGLVGAVVAPLIQLAGNSHLVFGALLAFGELTLLSYSVSTAFAAVEVGTYRYTNRDFIRLVVSVTWVIVTAGYLVARHSL